jgi:two-component system, OmpR family, phosphate regulon sensor histidine kinase PhoR
MSKHSILVIHRNTSLGEDIKHILAPAGYKVFYTPDPQNADEAINDYSPDLVLIEEQLEGIDGQEAASKIIEGYFNLPVIVITNPESPVSDAKAMRMGFSDHLPHPLSSQQLLDAITGALSHRDRIQARVAEVLEQNTQSIKNRLDIFETLQRTGRSVTSSLDLDDVLKTVVDAAVDLTNAEEGSLLLLDESSGELYVRAARNLQDEFVHTFRLPIQDTLAGQVLRTGKAVKLQDETPRKIKTSYFVYALIYVPIRIHERVLGVLGVDNRQSKQFFTEDHLTIVSSLADFAATAIENARLYSQSEHERSRLESILTDVADGVIVLDLEGRLLLVNRAARAIFGLDEKDLIGKSYQDVFIHPDLLEVLDTSEFSPGRTEISLEDGRIFNTNTTAIPEIGYALTMQDITHLKELDRIKSDFVSTVSHDLRSPLTAILGYVELIARAGPINNQQREFIKRVEFSVNNITSLINDLLDLGRIEAGFDARKELVHIPLIIQYTIEGISSRIEEKQQAVVIQVGENLPPVLGNPVRLRQMIHNLVSNAIKYTPQKGCIEISAREESGQIIISVSDNGPGIPPADQPYIFDKFYRGSNIAYDSPGTGLGLAIVKSIVDNHLGRIWVESTPGVDTTFTVVLPVADTNL